MPEAGILSIGPKEIRFGSDGHWYADDDVIAHKRIALLFSKHVQADGDGGWVIDVGVDRRAVVVDDTPLVVSALREEGGDLWLTTNDGERSPLVWKTLSVGPDNVPRCVVQREGRGSLPARFLRAAWYQLARYVEPDGNDWLVSVGGNRHRIRAEVCEDSSPDAQKGAGA